MSFCLDYDFEIERIAQEIRSARPRKILIQLPNGLQRCFDYITQRLREYISREDTEIVLSLNPSHGPCLVDEYVANEVRADLIVHFGHTEYPLHKPGVKTLFVPVEYKSVDIDKIRSLLDSLCTSETTICLVSTSQHIKLCKEIEMKNARCRIVYRGVVFGCIPANSDNCSTLVVVAGGRFSCVSQSLALWSKHQGLQIYCLDPYTYNLWDPKSEYLRLLKIRLWKVNKALSGRKWLIITGFYGQSRTEIVYSLAKKLEESGFEVSISKVFRLSQDVIENLGSSFDAIVIASCPYLAFDLYDLDIPVLTVGEALMILSNSMDRYIYPW